MAIVSVAIMAFAILLLLVHCPCSPLSPLGLGLSRKGSMRLSCWDHMSGDQAADQAAVLTGGGNTVLDSDWLHLSQAPR